MAWLPDGDRDDVDPATDATAVLAGADRSALVTLTEYIAQSSAEEATTSTDVVLARRDGHLHAFARDPADRTRLVASSLVDDKVRDTLAGMLG